MSVTTKRAAACILGFLAAVATMVALIAPPTTPVAAADPCPDVAIVFARGTDEPAGVGLVGQAFVDALTSRLVPRTVGTYAVNYPANSEIQTGAPAGGADATNHMTALADVCPNTRMVLGGMSQGAAVAELVMGSLPPNVAGRVDAAVLFGTPRSLFATLLYRGPVPTITPSFAGKTLDLCAKDDPVCSSGFNLGAHSAYVDNGMVGQGADFAAGKL